MCCVLKLKRKKIKEITEIRKGQEKKEGVKVKGVCVSGEGVCVQRGSFK